jgi:tetratricopeptide (TPR) repeat protein
MARASAGGDPWAQATLGHVYALLGLEDAAGRSEAAALNLLTHDHLNRESLDGADLAGAALACARAWAALRQAEAEPQQANWQRAVQCVQDAAVSRSPLTAHLWLALARGLRDGGEAVQARRAFQVAHTSQGRADPAIPAEVWTAEWALTLLPNSDAPSFGEPSVDPPSSDAPSSDAPSFGELVESQHFGEKSDPRPLAQPSELAPPPNSDLPSSDLPSSDLPSPNLPSPTLPSPTLPSSDARALRALAALQSHGNVGALTELADALEAVERVDLRRTCAFALAERLSVLGAHRAALAAMHAYPLFPRPTGPRDWACRGVLLRRQHHDPPALRDLDAALRAPDSLPPPLWVRVNLHRADVLYRQNRVPEALDSLREALPALVRLSAPQLLAPDVAELTTLMQLAALEPELSGWAEQAYGAVSQREPESAGALAGWTLDTLGQATLRRGGQPVPLRWPETSLLIAYLTLQGEVTRTQAELDLFPDLPPKQTLALFRQALAELRAHLGPDAVRVGGPKRFPTYTLLIPVALDIQRPSAVAAAPGLFLPLLPHTGWVAERRTLHRLTDQHFIEQQSQKQTKDRQFRGYD